jgi:hypothetical protein
VRCHTHGSRGLCRPLRGLVAKEEDISGGRHDVERDTDMGQRRISLDARLGLADSIGWPRVAAVAMLASSISDDARPCYCSAKSGH